MTVLGLLVAAAAIYCGLYGAFCCQNKKTLAGVGAWVLAVITAGASVWAFFA